MSEEAHRSFPCFGGTATVHVGEQDSGDGEEAAERSRRCLLDAHERLSRFLPASELSLLNRDSRRDVPASALLRLLAVTAKMAGVLSQGLVDATLLREIEEAGYRDPLAGRPRPSLGTTPRPRPTEARPHPGRRWREIRVDETAATISRPPGLQIDSGGIAKGLIADLVASDLRSHGTYAVDCCGDIRIGGTTGRTRQVVVGNPFGGNPVHKLRISDGAVATTGITNRRWVGPDGTAAHHLLDPRSGKPAFTGVVQATAVAPTGVFAEVYAKAALLSGPAGASGWLPHGGVIVMDDGQVTLIEARRPLGRRGSR